MLLVKAGDFVFFFLFAKLMKKKGHVNENTMKPLGCSSQWASYTIWAQAVAAYEKYITFAFIEFKAAALFCQKPPMVSNSVRMCTSLLAGCLAIKVHFY